MTRTYEDLPPECLLQVIAFLNLPDTTALLQTSTLWHSLITENENTIYYHLALLNDPVEPLGSLEAARRNWVSLAARQVRNWKEYCKLQLHTRQRWLGKSRANMSWDILRSGQRSQVHRFKIDTEKLLLIMTGEAAQDFDASLVVHCLRDDARPMLFQLNQVSSLAHVEMSNGFIVFTCEKSRLLEVWRWAEDQADDPVHAKPEPHQINMHQNAMEAAGFHLDREPYRGELVPMGVLRHPADLRATRLVYPTLCVGSRLGDRLWLWNIRTRQITQTINIEPCPYEAFGMLYVDVNETHAFVASHTVSVYSRTTGQCVFQFRDSQLEELTSCVDYPAREMLSMSVFEKYALEAYREPLRNDHLFSVPSDIVMAVHVSPTGDNFVAITFRGFIFYVSGLKDTVIDHEAPAGDLNDESVNEGTPSTPVTPSSSKSPADNSLEKFKVSVARGGRNLETLAYDGRRILADGVEGLCLINLEPQTEDVFPVLINDKPVDIHPFPARSLYRVPPFGGEEEDYGDCSCIQMTQEAFWIAWQPETHHRQNAVATDRKAIGMMMFSEEGGAGSSDGP